jgi:hypothetical protein
MPVWMSDLRLILPQAMHNLPEGDPPLKKRTPLPTHPFPGRLRARSCPLWNFDLQIHLGANK